MKLLRILKNLFVGILLFSGVVLILLFTGLQWPELWLRESTLNFAKKQFNQQFSEMELNWDNVQVQTTKLGFMSRRLLVSVQGFCFLQPVGTKACFQTVQLGLAYDLPELEVLEVGPAVALGGDVFFQSTEPKKQDSETVHIPRIPEWLESAQVQKIEVEIEKYELHIAEKILKGDLRVTSNGNAVTSDFRIHASINEQEWGRVDVTAISPDRQLEGPWHLESSVDLNLPASTEFQADIQVRYTENRLTAALDGNIVGKGRAQLKDCRLLLDLHEARRASASIDCEVNIPTNQFQRKNLKYLTRNLQNPTVSLDITSSVAAAYPFETKNLITGRIRVRPFSNFEHVLALSGGFASDFEFVAEDLPQLQSFRGKLDLVADIPAFEKVVEFLSGSPYEVPAPFLVLSGPMRLAIAGSVGTERAVIDSRLETQLSSRHQRLVTRTRAQVDLALRNLIPQNAFIDSEIDLRQVRFVLPPIETGPPGQIFPDQRITNEVVVTQSQTTGSSTAEKFPLEYQILVHTKKEKPIRLVSSLTERPIAFGVRMKMTDEVPFQGEMNLQPVHYNFAGLEGATGGLSLKVRGTDYQTVARGVITNAQGQDQSQVLIAQDPSDSLVRPQPKLPIPLVELVTALGFKNPFSLVVLDQRRPNPPQTSSGFGTVPVEIQRRKSE